MTLACNCDMPIEIYCDWLQDQGWDCEEMRSGEEVVLDYTTYDTLQLHLYNEGAGTHYPRNRGNGNNFAEGTGDAYQDYWGCVFSNGNAKE